MPLKGGGGYMKGDRDWRCPPPCKRWHREKTNQCPHCKAIPRWRRSYENRRELEARHKDTRKVWRDDWLNPRVNGEVEDT